MICNVTKRGVISLRPVRANSQEHANDTLPFLQSLQSLQSQHSLHSLHSQVISSSQNALHVARPRTLALDVARPRTLALHVARPRTLAHCMWRRLTHSMSLLTL
jgi:hypothetical protein